MGSLNWASGIPGLIPLGRLHPRPLQQHFHSLGLTNWFTPLLRSDPFVLANLGNGRTYLFSHLESLSVPSRGGYDFHGHLHPGLVRPHGDSQISGIWTCSDRRLHINTSSAQGGNFGPPSLGFSITGPPSYDRYRHMRQYHCCSLYQLTRWKPFPHLVRSSSRSVPVPTNVRYSHTGQIHSGLPQCDSGPPSRANQPITTERSPQNSEPILQDVGNSSSGHVCHRPQHASSPVMSTPFKGGRHIVLLLLASGSAIALALVSGLTLRHPLLDFFWVHQNMIPAL